MAISFPPGCSKTRLSPTALALSLTGDARRALEARLGLSGAEMKDRLCALGVDMVLESDCYWDDHAHAEAVELLSRLREGGPLPQLVYACPEWRQRARAERPELSPFFSRAALHARRQARAARALASARLGVAPESVTHILAVGCPAKKAALLRDAAENGTGEGREYVLTVRELARWLSLEPPLEPKASVAQPAPAPAGGERLRDMLAHAVLLHSGKAPAPDFLEFRPVGAGVEEAVLRLDGLLVRAALVRGLGNAFALMERVLAGESRYHVVEVLTCVGGCGGG